MPISWDKRSVALAAAAILALAVFLWMRFTPEAAPLLDRLPRRDATVGQVDVAALRAAGFAPGGNTGALREPEYEDFIRRSGFNWENDLDRLTWSFTATAKYFLAEGRFDWRKLDAFVKAEGGECREGFCTVRGSQPGREISFFPIGSGVMALAVSADRYAADQLRQEQPAEPGHPLSKPPAAPLWVHFSKFSLHNGEPESPGLRGFARILRETEEALLLLEPKDGAFVLRLDARCESPQKAQALAGDLTKLTELLNRMLKMEKAAPGEADFASVLANGRFDAEQNLLHGNWPITKAFLTSLISEQ
ncbi:MAG: hypothetical protein IT169_03520 [Bryobacterales bacterium]|nr:hypothetical protein [Bryobacterales bacterium]